MKYKFILFSHWLFKSPVYVSKEPQGIVLYTEDEGPILFIQVFQPAPSN